jgi:hypothetical protein
LFFHDNSRGARYHIRQQEEATNLSSEVWQMHKHWAVALAFVAMTVGLTAIWTSCGDDAAADAGVADTGVAQCKGKAAGDACAGGFCLDIIANEMECQLECTTAGDTCELAGSSGACYNIGINGKNACLKAGDKAIGETCGAFNDCRAGMACLDMGDGLVCLAICGSVDTCSGDNPSCDPSGFGFGVCLEGGVTACEDVENNDCPEGSTCTDVDGDLICVAD